MQITSDISWAKSVSHTAQPYHNTSSASLKLLNGLRNAKRRSRQKKASEYGLLRTSICHALKGLMKTTKHLIFGDNQQISETGIEQARLKFVTLTYPFL
jgi:hypothetical protein